MQRPSPRARQMNRDPQTAKASTSVSSWLNFNPYSVDPILWLDAADTNTITESSGSVSQWENKGSFGNFTQSSGAVQPVTGVSTLNGFNVIDFTADYLTAVDQNEWKILHDGTPWIFAACVKYGTGSNPNAAYMLFGNQRGAPADIGACVFFDDRLSVPRNDAAVHQITWGGGGANYVYLLIQQNFLTPNIFLVHSHNATPINATANDRVSVFVNDGQAIKGNTATGTPSTGNPTRVMQVGAGGANASPMTGSIAELIIVAGSNATEVNRIKLRDYLDLKWGVY